MTRQVDPIRRHPIRSLQERAEAAQEVMQALKQANDLGWPIVVEGPSDEIALRELGLAGEILRLNQGISVLAAIEELVARHRVKAENVAESENIAKAENVAKTVTTAKAEAVAGTGNWAETSNPTSSISTSTPRPASSHAPTANPSLKGFILLTDWDRKGGQLARRLREAGKACGLKADSEFRRRLAFYTGSQIRCVEDLPGFFKRGLGTFMP